MKYLAAFIICVVLTTSALAQQVQSNTKTRSIMEVGMDYDSPVQPTLTEDSKKFLAKSVNDNTISIDQFLEFVDERQFDIIDRCERRESHLRSIIKNDERKFRQEQIIQINALNKEFRKREAELLAKINKLENEISNKKVLERKVLTPLSNELIHSAKSGMMEDGKFWINSGKLVTHVRDNKTLWDIFNEAELLYKDESFQKWKEIDNSILDYDYKTEAENYMVFNETEVLTTSAKIQHARMFEWGCDFSIVAVLSLEVKDFSSWGTVALEMSDSYGDPTITEISNCQIPQIINDNEHYDKGGVDAKLLKWESIPNIEVYYISSEFYQWIIVYDKKLNTYDKMDVVNPFAARC